MTGVQQIRDVTNTRRLESKYGDRNSIPEENALRRLSAMLRVASRKRSVEGGGQPHNLGPPTRIPTDADSNSIPIDYIVFQKAFGKSSVTTSFICLCWTPQLWKPGWRHP